MKHTYFFALCALMITLPAALLAQNPCNVEGVVVEASNFQYSPSVVTIEPGQTVVWINNMGFHDVNGVVSTIGEPWENPETFYIDAISGSSDGVCLGTYTFTVEGVYHYDCSIGSHAQLGMVGEVQVIASNPTFVSEASKTSNLTLYPNPTVGGAVTLTGDWNSGASLSCYDAQGRLVHQTSLVHNQHVLDVDDWKAGSYSVVVAWEDQRMVRQFMVR